MRYKKTIVVRCSENLKRSIERWSKKAGMRPTEATRRVLEVAFQVEGDTALPPGIKPIKPTQEAPGKA